MFMCIYTHLGMLFAPTSSLLLFQTADTVRQALLFDAEPRAERVARVCGLRPADEGGDAVHADRGAVRRVAGRPRESTGRVRQGQAASGLNTAPSPQNTHTPDPDITLNVGKTRWAGLLL